MSVSKTLEDIFTMVFQTMKISAVSSALTPLITARRIENPMQEAI